MPSSPSIRREEIRLPTTGWNEPSWCSQASDVVASRRRDENNETDTPGKMEYLWVVLGTQKHLKTWKTEDAGTNPGYRRRLSDRTMETAVASATLHFRTSNCKKIFDASYFRAESAIRRQSDFASLHFGGGILFGMRGTALGGRWSAVSLWVQYKPLFRRLIW